MKSYFDFQGKNVSALTLGLMTNISREFESEKLNLFIEAYSLGVNSFDTAPNYQNGYSDEFLGKLISEIGRDKLFISSKVYFTNPYSNLINTLSRDHIINSVEGSLRNINTDYIDCLILHRFDAKTKIEETLETLFDLINEGKIKSWGISAFTLEQVLDYYYRAKEMDIPTPIIGQYAYNLFNRSIEADLCTFANNKGLKLFTYYSLAQGVLTGKYVKKINDSRINDPVFKQYMWDLTNEKILLSAEFKSYCDKNNIDNIGLSYLWCLRNLSVGSIITNVRNKEQLYHNINCLKSGFNSEIRSNLDRIFKNKPINQYTGIHYEIDERKL